MIIKFPRKNKQKPLGHSGAAVGLGSKNFERRMDEEWMRTHLELGLEPDTRFPNRSGLVLDRTPNIPNFGRPNSKLLEPYVGLSWTEPKLPKPNTEPGAHPPKPNPEHPPKDRTPSPNIAVFGVGPKLAEKTKTKSKVWRSGSSLN